ncbi:MAG: metallophosphoesterase [Saprospiraceae bacterium]|nr:metallophosphoesterase [Lewinella sp.]
MRIVQLTDLHIGLPDEATFEADVRGNLLKACQKIRQLRPDYVVVSGDLCFQDPDPTVYTWIRQQLDALDITYDLISGNHDDPVMMARIFEREHLLVENALYFQRQLEGAPYLFLDTTTGVVDEVQLQWLHQALKQQTGQVFIFMHHPPTLAGVPHMDQKYAMQNRDQVMEILLDYPGRIDIFCGHYHVDKVLGLDNVNIYITPSCFFQIDQFSESFAVDHRRPALRYIDITGEYLRHSVIYL